MIQSKALPNYGPPLASVARTDNNADESVQVMRIDDSFAGCSWHYHPEFQIGHVVEGSGERIIGDCVHAIVPGEVILLGANLPHVWRYEHSTENCSAEPPMIQANVVHFKQDFLGDSFLERPEFRSIRLLMARASQGLQFTGETRKQVAELVEKLHHQASLDRILTLVKILDLCSRSSEVLMIGSLAWQPIAAHIEFERLRVVVDYVKKNFAEPIDRDAMADLAHLSPSSFSRFFKARTGIGFHDFLTDVRIGQACRLLAGTNMSILDIALQCGFGDLSTFNRSFKRLRNISPRDYRNQLQRLCRT